MNPSTVMKRCAGCQTPIAISAYRQGAELPHRCDECIEMTAALVRPLAKLLAGVVVLEMATEALA